MRAPTSTPDADMRHVHLVARLHQPDQPSIGWRRIGGVIPVPKRMLQMCVCCGGDWPCLDIRDVRATLARAARGES